MAKRGHRPLGYEVIREDGTAHKRIWEFVICATVSKAFATAFDDVNSVSKSDGMLDTRGGQRFEVSTPLRCDEGSWKHKKSRPSLTSYSHCMRPSQSYIIPCSRS